MEGRKGWRGEGEWWYGKRLGGGGGVDSGEGGCLGVERDVLTGLGSETQFDRPSRSSGNQLM